MKRIRPPNDFERHAHDLDNLERTLRIVSTRPIGESIYVYRQNEADRVNSSKCIKLIEFRDNGRAVSAQLRVTARNIIVAYRGNSFAERGNVYTRKCTCSMHRCCTYIATRTRVTDRCDFNGTQTRTYRAKEPLGVAV